MVTPEGTDPPREGTLATQVPDRQLDEPGASVIFIAYGIESVDMSWIPEIAPVLVVHNDGLLPESACRSGCIHINPGENVGFGRGVNLALEKVATTRVIICNPDVALTPVHWDALTAGEGNEIVTVPLVDSDGGRKASAFPYPSPTLLVLGITRAIKIAPAGTVRRKILVRVLGDWGQTRKWSIAQPPGDYPLATWWASGAVMSFGTRMLKDVDGFDPNYFLYLEDTDLCRRIAKTVGSVALVIADTPPAIHQVGGSARTPADRQRVALERWRSARRYASTEKGVRWRLAGSLLSIGAIFHRLRAALSATPVRAP